ncbi:MAG TPA: UDP-N-acetylglucosamine 2-epimerase (non-hydrolyzing) [Candidatus Omnitrophota bacterium]|nr:UDP-N-acetylglucosamine 2-epimerase (non-hydrolyzing) [Candidatus Omnitrophota bacterium]HPN57075.1 UDP-N-acetylglucosamine 2-epimerase (non-hydrolyzing) [Candidatus Omnitrophota bacterium]
MRTKKRIIFVAGARPNFMKIACLLKECRRQPAVRSVLVHSGQHYDQAMSDRFFQDLDIPAPQYCLGVGSGSHAEQTAKVMTAFENVCRKEKPAIVVVVGDVNSTVAACLAAKKLNIPVAHVEAGLRSFDRAMPEEVNRIVTDSISDFLFVTEPSGVDNLRKEGHAANTIHFVGNTMIDSLITGLKKLHDADKRSWASAPLTESLKRYGVLTLHRPVNVDHKQQLKRLIAMIADVTQQIPVIFPAHPRTRKNIEAFRIQLPPQMHCLDPLGYLEFLSLCRGAKFVLTDSGGIQEETTFMRVPCLTLRSSTERPVTLREGTNLLIGDKIDRVPGLVRQILREKSRAGTIPALWDGKASKRIIRILVRAL